MSRQVASRPRWGWPLSHAAVGLLQHLAATAGQTTVGAGGRSDPRRTWSRPPWPPGTADCPGCWPGRRCSGRRCPRPRSPRPTPEGDVPQQVVADRIHPVVGGELARRDLVHAGVGHLLAAQQQPAVDLDVGRGSMPAAMHMAGHHTQWNRMISLPIRWWTAGHQASNRSLVLAVADGREIVDERVVPDIEDVLLVPGDRHAPVDGGPGDGDVPEPPLDEAEGLVALGLGHHRVGLASYQSMSGCSKALEPEEVVLLLEVLHRHPVDRAQSAVEEVVLGVVLLTRARSRGRGRCPCRCSRSRRSGQELWTAPVVAGLGGADEVVVGDVEVGPGRGEPGGQLVGPPGGVSPAPRRPGPPSGRARRCR